jgi:hypothetical protein
LARRRRRLGRRDRGLPGRFSGGVGWGTVHLEREVLVLVLDRGLDLGGWQRRRADDLGTQLVVLRNVVILRGWRERVRRRHRRHGCLHVERLVHEQHQQQLVVGGRGVRQ